MSQTYQEVPKGIRVGSKEGFDPTRADITLRLSEMPGLADLLDDLSAELGKPSVETIALGLILLRIAVDAGKEGKWLAITDDELEVEREVLIPGRPHAVL